MLSSSQLACHCLQLNSELSKEGGGSKYSMLSKAYHDVPCLNITCSNNDLFLIMYPSLNLFLNGIMTNVGNCIIVHEDCFPVYPYCIPQ